MSTFALHLESATRYERIDAVESFVAQDASGQFGLLARHERFVTVLVPGLARYRLRGAAWAYVALAGGVARFAEGELHVSTARYLRGEDTRALGQALRERLAAEDAALGELRSSVRRLEQQMLERLYELERPAP